MAVRNLRIEGDEILRKKSRVIDNIDDRILQLLDDMVDTMYENEGIGLAAVQVGVLKRAVVMDLGEGPIKMINPEIIEKSGEQVFTEGCLSVPEKTGSVKRPESVSIQYMNESGEQVKRTAEGLEAVCICHELDHLEGVLFIDKIIPEEIINE